MPIARGGMDLFLFGRRIDAGEQKLRDVRDGSVPVRQPGVSKRRCEQVLQHVSFLGNVRKALPSVALNRIADLPPLEQLNPALWTAVVVLLAWAAVALGIGAWRTRTREI